MKNEIDEGIKDLQFEIALCETDNDPHAIGYKQGLEEALAIVKRVRFEPPAESPFEKACEDMGADSIQAGR